MADRNISGAVRKRRKRGAVYIPIALFLVLLAMIIGVSLFFRVTEIDVEGSETYTDEDILSVSGIEIGDNTFFISESKAAISICAKLPYVDAVKIVRTLPDKITIVITESYPIASVNQDSSYWILDNNCRLLENTDSSGAAGTISVTGITLVKPEAGLQASTGEDGDLKLEYIADVLTAILDKEMQNSISHIDISAVSQIEFNYTDKFTVRFGRGDYAAQKMELLLKILSSLEEGNTGVIEFSSESEAHFIPN